MMKKVFLIFVCFMLTGGGALADTVRLESGREIQGRVIDVTEEYIRILSDGQIIRLPFRAMDGPSAEYYKNFTPDTYDPGETVHYERQYSEQLEVYSKTYKQYWDAGMKAADQGQFEKAVENFTEAILIHDSLAQPYYFRAGAYQQIGRYAEAIEDYSKLISMFPDDDELYARRGWVYQLSGQPDKAVEDYSMALAIYPYNFDLLMERYGLYMTAGKKALALKDLQMILRLAPAAAEAYMDYAFLSYELGNYYTAWQNVRKAREQGLSFPEDFLKKLEAAMPDPFRQGAYKVGQDAPRGFARNVIRVFGENLGFLVVAIVAGFLGLVIFMLPSIQRQDLMKASRHDADMGEGPVNVVFAKAGIFKRATAALIDLIILSLLSWAVSLLFRKDVFAVVLGLLYLFKEASDGVSIGKIVMGLRVVDEHGRAVGLFQGFLRNATLGVPLICFYVVFFLSGFRLNFIGRIAALILCALFILEGLIAVLSFREGRRLGDRLGGVMVHDLHPDRKGMLYGLWAIGLLAVFLIGTISLNMLFNKAFIYRLHPARYYNVENDISFRLPKKWRIIMEGEAGVALVQPKKNASLMLLVNQDARDYSLEACVRAFSRAIEEEGMQKQAEEKMRVAGLPAVRVAFIDSQTGNAAFFVYFKKDKGDPLYIFHAAMPANVMSDVLPSVAYIVNSFRFE